MGRLSVVALLAAHFVAVALGAAGDCDGKGAPQLCEGAMHTDSSARCLALRGHTEITLRCESVLQQARASLNVPHPAEILVHVDSFRTAGRFDLTDKTIGGLLKAAANLGDGFMITTLDKGKQYLFKKVEQNEYSDKIEPLIEGGYKLSTKSSLTRIFAILAVGKGKNKLRWMMMDNWMPITFPLLYQLKGSTKGSVEKPGNNQQKDLDFRKAGLRILVPSDKVATVLQGVKADSAVLEKQEKMGYALTLGQLVFKVPRCDPAHKTDSCVCSKVKEVDIDHSAKTGEFPKEGTEVCVNVADKTDRPEYWASVRRHFCTEDDIITVAGKTPMPLKENCYGTIQMPKEGELDMRVGLNCFGIDGVGQSYGFFGKIGALFGSKATPEKYKQRFDDFIEGAVMGEYIESGEEAHRGHLAFEPPAKACNNWGSKQTYQSAHHTTDIVDDFDSLGDYTKERARQEDEGVNDYENPPWTKGYRKSSGSMHPVLIIVIIILCMVVVAAGVVYMFFPELLGKGGARTVQGQGYPQQQMHGGQEMAYRQNQDFGLHGAGQAGYGGPPPPGYGGGPGYGPQGGYNPNPGQPAW